VYCPLIELPVVTSVGLSEVVSVTENVPAASLPAWSNVVLTVCSSVAESAPLIVLPLSVLAEEKSSVQWRGG
jgi:hypothetical protein